MARFIDADALPVSKEYLVDEAGFGASFHVVHKSDIDKAPTVEVVRCKDCGNGISYKLKDCTIVIKEHTEDEHAGKLTIGIEYKHNEDWYGNYVVADENTEFAELLTGLVGFRKLQEEVCGKCKLNGYEPPTAEVIK